MGDVASITGIHHLSLTVTELTRSTEWYRTVLGFSIDAEIRTGAFERVRLRHPSHGLTLALTRHLDGRGDRFDEHRTGMDHVAFSVPTAADVAAWKRHLEALDVPHSEIQDQPEASRAMITLRDPDGIQLEVVAATVEA